jgi:phosphoribosylpyrophosphate synthetase
MDLHAAQIQGFFDIPLDNLFAARSSRATSRSASRAAT